MGSHKQAFMEITLHYVNEKTLRFISHALGCRRFKHSHTGDQVAAMMAKIFMSSKLATKLLVALQTTLATW